MAKRGHHSCFPRSCHELAISHIVDASRHASEGRHDESAYHIKAAETHAKMHHENLKAMGRGDEAKEYLSGISDHINRIQNLRGKIKKSEKCEEDHKKLKKQCNSCGYMVKVIKKAESPFSLERRKSGKPKQDSRYDYKPIHELHPHDQQLAQQKFGGKDIGSHEYPVDKQTGRLVHGTRAPFGGKAPQAARANYKQIKPEHKPGTPVRITGHQLEGKLGIVGASHPLMSGKIAVQIGPSEHHKVYVEPHQVKLSRPTGKVEKALVTLHNIKKVFMK